MPPESDAVNILATLSALGETLEALRERLARPEPAPGSGPEAAATPADLRASLADRDEHALAIFQEILSVPPLGLPPSELFALAMDRVSRLLAADRTLLLVIDAQSGRLVPRSGRGFRRDDLETISLDAREGLVGRVFREKRVLVHDAEAEPLAEDPFIGRFPSRQAIAVPVRTEGEVGGVLFAGRAALGAPFTTTDVLLLLVIADRVGSALVHQNLLERRGEHIVRLKELRGALEASLPGQDRIGLLARACEVGRRLLGLRAAAVALGEAPDTLELTASSGWPESRTTPRLGAADGLLSEAHAADGPVAVRDLHAYRPGEGGLLGGTGLRAWLLAPLRVRGRSLGLLCLADPEVKDFSAEEIESAHLLASLIAVALENERLYDELRRALESLRAQQGRLVDSEKARLLLGLAAGISREFTGIFAGILGKTQLLLGRAHEDVREGLTVIEEAAWRGADIVRRLSGLAAAESGDSVAALELPAVAQDVLAFTQARWKDEAAGRGAHIELVADLRPTPPVEASGTALREAVVNLIVNAVEAMPGGGQLTVRTRPRDRGAELEVTDTGQGIGDEVLPFIFEPFFTTRGPRRLGLGLCVVHGVVTRYHGRLEVRSGRGGTRMALWLPEAGTSAPAVPDLSARPAEPMAGPAAGGAPPPATVLIVEEEEPLRSMLVGALGAAGYRVQVADDAADGLARLEQQRFDLVLTDLALRDGSGLQVARAVKRMTPGTAVVLITGWGHLLHGERVRESGVDLMLVKPLQREGVLSAVSEALRLRAVG